MSLASTSVPVCEVSDFEAAIAQDKFTLVDFGATWCGPCRFIAPEFEKLKDEYTSMNFIKIDIDDCDEVAGKYDITSVPTFILFHRGEIVDSMTGAEIKKLRAMVDKHTAVAEKLPRRTSSSSRSSRTTHTTRTSSGKCGCGENH
jgi:thioredoxin 1